MGGARRVPLARLIAGAASLRLMRPAKRNAAIGAVCLAACGRTAAPPPAPTFDKDVAPIVYSNCAPCHRPGEVAPFPLLTYADVVKHADNIVRETSKRHMPPWLPDRGDFPIVGERRLRADQIDTIRQWVATGMKEGSPADLPPAPRWPEGWQLGKPDIVLTPDRPSIWWPEPRTCTEI